MLNWKDIETAPNTGEEILIWCSYTRKYEIVKAEGNLWRHMIDSGDRLRYTKWAPINPPAVMQYKEYT